MAREAEALNTRFAWVALAAPLIASPLGLAASGFSAASLAIDGLATVGGGGTALFALVGESGLAWDGSAAGVVIERTYAPFVTADPPKPLPSNSFYDGSQTTRETYGASSFTGAGARPHGALLALVSASDFLVSASAEALAIQPAHDPTLNQGPPTDVETRSSDSGPDFSIHQRVPGEFLNVTAPSGTFEVRGNLVIRLLDVDYSLTSDGQTVTRRTGDVETSRTGALVQGQRETHTITLIDAVLRVRAADPVTLLATRPVVTFSGALSATDEHGGLDVPTLAPAEPGRWTGSGTLALEPAGDAIALVQPAGVQAAGGAVVSRTPQLFALGALLGLLLVLAVVAALRLRRARTGDLELALLAMGERRWSDALPHLDRLAAKRPDDAAVMMDRAICLEESGRLAEAREGYEAALRAEPHNAEAHYYYARTLARLRMGTAALAHLSRALALDARLAELARNEGAFADFRDHPLFRGLVRS